MTTNTTHHTAVAERMKAAFATEQQLPLHRLVDCVRGGDLIALGDAMVLWLGPSHGGSDDRVLVAPAITSYYQSPWYWLEQQVKKGTNRGLKSLGACCGYYRHMTQTTQLEELQRVFSIVIADGISQQAAERAFSTIDGWPGWDGFDRLQEDCA